MRKPVAPSGHEKSEFLGLHDPYADVAQKAPTARQAPSPWLTKEKVGELARAAVTLAVILAVVALVVAALT